jgi:GNAT superfamily N-acetyltransferase
MRPLMADELVEVACRVLPLGHLPLLRYQPRGRYAEQGGVRLAAYNLPGLGHNLVAVTGEAPPPEQIIALAAEFFRDAVGPWSIVVVADRGHPLEAALRARDWPVSHEHAAMVMPTIGVAPPPAADVQVRRVVDEHGLHDWFAAPFARAASRHGESATDPVDEDALLDDRYHRLLIPSLAVALDPDVALFTGYLDSQPVATAALYRIEGVAEIGGVFTARPFRRRGIGEALTWAALAEGVARRCTAAALNASPAGAALYRRMGFLPACTFRVYDAPP